MDDSIKMKKILITFMAAISILSVNAESHMTFKGVEINGTASAVSTKLKELGYTFEAEKNSAILLQGNFLGSEVGLIIYSTPISHTAYSVQVCMKLPSDWRSIKAMFENINEKLTTKYGKPSEVIKKFDEPYSENFHPVEAIKENKLEYKIRYILPSGGVTLALMSFGYNFPILSIHYWDKEGRAMFNKESINEL